MIMEQYEFENEVKQSQLNTLKYDGIIMKIINFFTIILVTGSTIGMAEVSITIYNNDLALVHESREFNFPKGIGEVRFTDVAARIIPTSVHFSSQNAVLLEQNYEYDLVSSQKLLEKYVDQQVELFTDNDKLFYGKLLSASNGIVIEEKDGSIRSLSQSKIFNIHFPNLPDGLITQPTLVWVTQSQNGGKGVGEASYLTRGISWETEYVVVLAEGEKSLDMSGWVNITNNSGATYNDAKIKLMAGDVNIESKHRRDRPLRSAGNMALVASAPNFEEKSFYEYHLYTLKRNSTIAENQVKQISLFPSAEVTHVNKEYRYEWYNQRRGNGNKVFVTLVFENDKSNNLEIPLPKGLIHVYKADSDGSTEFIGEDKIDHTPRKEEIRVSTGNAFDIVGERKKLDSRREELKNKSVTIEKYEIRIRNRKDENIEVIVGEQIYGEWEMLDATRGWKKKSANLVEWTVNVKPDEDRIITYSVQIVRKHRKNR